jgi:hypothetical protein
MDSGIRVKMRPSVYRERYYEVQYLNNHNNNNNNNNNVQANEIPVIMGATGTTSKSSSNTEHTGISGNQ